MINYETIDFLLTLENLKEKSKNGILPLSKATDENYENCLFYIDDKDSDDYLKIAYSVRLHTYGSTTYDLLEDCFGYYYISDSEDDEDKYPQVESYVHFDDDQPYISVDVTDSETYDTLGVCIEDGNIIY